MAFTVEDGTGLSNANSYASVAAYRDYHTERGRDVSTQTDGQIQSYLIRATDYIEKRFRGQWLGSRATDEQALSHPREDVYIDGVLLPDDDLYIGLEQGTMEYGLRASRYEELAPDPPVPFDRTSPSGGSVSGGGQLTGKREKVGPIEEENTYSDPSTTGAGSIIVAYPAADLLISPLLNGSGRGRTIRA